MAGPLRSRASSGNVLYLLINLRIGDYCSLNNDCKIITTYLYKVNNLYVIFLILELSYEQFGFNNR
jgi:hypothetical protein